MELEDWLGVSKTFNAVLKISEYYINSSERTLHIFMWLNNMMTSAFLKDHISVISYGIWDELTGSRMDMGSSPIRLFQRNRWW